LNAKLLIKDSLLQRIVFTSVWVPAEDVLADFAAPITPKGPTVALLLTIYSPKSVPLTLTIRTPVVHPEFVEGECSWFDKLITNGLYYTKFF